MLEEMKDPFIHLIRNCIDHGLEKPEERVRSGKPATGTITVTIAHGADKHAEILVSDDGAGIDAGRVREVAVGLGLVSRDDAETLDDAAILPLVFRSGMTTCRIITDISGRGLGLAIVREKVEKLGGAVSCESTAEAGTAFRIRLPLSLAAFRGVLVRAGEQLFVLPTSHVEQVTRIRREQIVTVENRETIALQGRVIPLLPLTAVLGLPPRPGRDAERKFLIAAVLQSSEKRIAVAVDEIEGEQEVLVKGLGRQLARLRNVAGSTILGNGKVVPILSVPDLVASAVRVSAAGLPASAPREAPARRSSILVAEDSVTSRTLLKNILEAAGYDVRTAVDGVDAFTTLKTGDFDLLVSDVDMPRMNGFDLTAKIRSDKKLSDLPVVLVTALDSRADRERGVDAGANAYIVKSSFDQSNLLEVIGRWA
jgi:two-component system chemotaxis sensor kinase CheA